MKLIIAIIRPEKLEAVQEALGEKEIDLMTVSDVRGCGRQRRPRARVPPPPGGLTPSARQLRHRQRGVARSTPERGRTAASQERLA